MKTAIFVLLLLLLCVLAGCDGDTPTAPPPSDSAAGIGKTVVLPPGDATPFVAFLGNDAFLAVDGHIWTVTWVEDPGGQHRWDYRQRCEIPVSWREVAFIGQDGRIWLMTTGGDLWRKENWTDVWRKATPPPPMLEQLPDPEILGPTAAAP